MIRSSSGGRKISIGDANNWSAAKDADLNEDAVYCQSTQRNLRPFRVLAFGIAIFIVLDASIFRSGLYATIVEPNSYAGRFEFICRQEVARKDQRDGRVVLFLGDSRVAEGFSVKVADESLKGDANNLRFVNASMPGSTLRTWFYLLKEIDPDCDQYDVVIIPFLDYEEIGTEENLNNRILDLRIVATRIELEDAIPFSLSFETARLRIEALRGTLLKGFLFRDDFTNLVKNFEERCERVQAFNERYAESLYNYEGNKQTMNGISIAPDGTTLVLPTHATDLDRRTLQAELLGDPRQPSEANARYFERWLLPILERYDATETIVLGIRMPRGPLPRPWDTDINRSSVVRRATADGSIILLGRDEFRDLESPQLFADSVHLNAAGRKQFSRRMAEQAAAILKMESHR